MSEYLSSTSEPVHDNVGTDKTVPYREFPGQTFRPGSKKNPGSVPGVPVVPGAGTTPKNISKRVNKDKKEQEGAYPIPLPVI